jgi:hypothetical protein
MTIAATCIRQKQHSTGRRLFCQQIGFIFNKRLAKCYICSIALNGAETWTLRKAGQKYLEGTEMWCWRRIEKISWTDCVRDEEVLYRLKEERNIVRTTKRRNDNCIGHILCRNCSLNRLLKKKQ